MERRKSSDTAHQERSRNIRVHILELTDNEAVVAFNHHDRNWIVREVCYFEPMPYKKARNHPTFRSDNYPYHTAGERSITDLATGQSISHSFEANDGEIQGLVYAVDAIIFGGELDCASYETYICEQMIPESFRAYLTDGSRVRS